MIETAGMKIEEAVKLRERDSRIRMLADAACSATFHDMRQRAEFDYEFEKEVRWAVHQAVVHLTAMIYEGDAEIKALRQERDAYKERALAGLNLSALPQMILPDALRPTAPHSPPPKDA